MSIDKHSSVCYNYYRKKGKELSSMTKTNTICYRTYDGNEYLAYYTYKNTVEAQAEADRLNTERPATLFNGEKVDWNRVKEFFVHRQEEFY
jgi:hypothetical protein